MRSTSPSAFSQPSRSPASSAWRATSMSSVIAWASSLVRSPACCSALGDRARSRLAMHGCEGRLRRRSSLGCGGVQELGDFEIGLIDPVRAGSRMSRRCAENERNSCCRGGLSNDHFILPSARESVPADAATRPRHSKTRSPPGGSIRRSERATIVREADCSAPVPTSAPTMAISAGKYSQRLGFRRVRTAWRHGDRPRTGLKPWPPGAKHIPASATRACKRAR